MNAEADKYKDAVNDMTDLCGARVTVQTLDQDTAMRASLRTALATCREHILNGSETPFACFAVGRLHLLLNEANDALKSYAQGIAYLLASDTCSQLDLLDAEEQWILRVVGSKEHQDGFNWASRLLELARCVKKGGGGPSPQTSSDLLPPVLIVAGGAASLNRADTRAEITSLLERVFVGLHGTVISGGTDSGVPGCVGAAAAALGPERAFKLVGFRPKLLSDDAPADKRYDVQIISGAEHFTLTQVIDYWEALLKAGITPNDVRLLGFGGGKIAAFEYRLALALGASTGVVELSGGAADGLLADEVWATMPNLLPLPKDPDSLRAFAHPAEKLAPTPKKSGSQGPGLAPPACKTKENTRR